MTTTTAEAVRDAVQDAVNGDHVLFCAPTYRQARVVFDALLDVEDFKELGGSVRHTNGQEQVTFPGGGRVYFKSSTGTGMRGVSAHKVYLHETSAADAYIRATILASTGGEIVKYTP